MDIRSSEWQDIIIVGAEHFNIEIPPEALDRFSLYASELLAWNRKKNLTAIIKPEEVAEKHMIDSIALMPYFSNTPSLIDIGSGGGFPGIPLKIMKPDLWVTLVDASRKKVSFLKHVIRRLNLSGIEAIHARAEELHTSAPHQNQYDVAVSRAFSAIDTFFLIARPFLKKQSRMIAMKGGTIEAETNKLNELLAKEDVTGIGVTIDRYKLPFSGSARSVVTIELS